MYRILALTDPELALLPAGGKAHGLVRLLRAGLPVPLGFCIVGLGEDATRRSPVSDPEVVASILKAWMDLGDGMVAVRSSAPLEDGARASFAGQQASVLGIRDQETLLTAIDRCWTSPADDRASSYAREQGLPESNQSMTVIVQRQIDAEVAGVLFTRNPLHDLDNRILIEASWGWGELVVSGRVTPDRYWLDRDRGELLDRQIAMKTTQSSEDGQRTVEAARQQSACLDKTQLLRLHELAREVEQLSGPGRDIEFALASGHCWLLQDRPITGRGHDAREQVRREEIDRLRARIPPGGTAWCRCNLTESLPTPTPMTWDLLQRMLSVKGALGGMYRDLGFEPDPGLAEKGVYELIAGRPYCDLRREPRLQFRWLPFEHDLSALARHPERAGQTSPRLNPRAADWHFWLLLPWHFWRLLRSSVQLRSLLHSFADEFEQRILPPYLREARAELNRDLATLSPTELLARLDSWADRTLVEFARESMKPTILATVALGGLERGLRRHLSAGQTRECCTRLLAGIQPRPETNIAGALAELGNGRLPRDRFRADFGHRGPAEMELAEPRWGELAEPTSLVPTQAVPSDAIEPIALWRRLAAEVGVPEVTQRRLESDVVQLATFVRLREAARHWLMLGTMALRRLLLRLGECLHLGEGIFLLTMSELAEAAAGRPMQDLIHDRRTRRRLLLGLPVPAVIFSDDLDAIGRSSAVSSDAEWQGTPLSPGVAEGQALVLEQPGSVQPVGGPWILVCPSTDPGWVCLLSRIQGLVVEQGGLLSHGAIVAREFHLPAVGGVMGITTRIRTGQRLRINGTTGQIALLNPSNLTTS